MNHPAACAAVKCRRTPALLAALLLTAAAALAAPAPRKPRPNVVLITMDTLRADRVGCYGARQVQTPALDALCRDGIVFERALSQVPLTWPSHAAILTGTYPFQNGVQDFTGQPLAPQFRSVAQAFQSHGYATGAVISAFVLDRSWGLARGFDYYDDAFSAETFHSKDIGLVDRRAQESVTHALAWLQKTSRKSPRQPFFLWLHLYDPHNPYDPPEPYRTQYRAHPYDGEIAYADHELGRLLAWLKSNRLYDNSLIVFLSDHGESLGEHGENEHGFFIYNSTVHIPLIVKPPLASSLKPARIASPVETIAVAPSLLKIAGLQDAILQQFENPAGLFAAESPDAAYSETFYPFSSFGWSPLHALETARYHYIDAPQPELYDLQADPGETNNLAARQTATAAVLKEKLQQRLARNPFSAASSSAPGLDQDAADKLRALGYVASRAPVSAAALASGLPDPKSKLDEFQSILQATDAYHAGDFPTGDALLAHVREQDPNIYIVPFMLGQGALRQKNWEKAASELRRCLELNPNFDQAMTGLAHALLGLGDTAGAQQWLQKALDYNPQNFRALYELGSIKARADKAAGIPDLEKAVQVQPNFAPLRRDLGLLQFELKNYAESSRHLARAVELGVQEPSIFNFLGISYSRTNRLQKAVESYKQALALQPDLAEAHLNLGFAYQRLGRGQSAKTEYAAACRLDQKFCAFAPKAD